MEYFDLTAEVLQIKNEVINLRRYFHQYPELGLEEFNTSKKIKEFLDCENIKNFSVSKTGICGIIEGSKNSNSKKCIALRADMDGLPIKEKNTCIYKSKIIGKMHGCGHDAHMAILLGASKILNKNRDKFSGTIKLIFEPAEETVGGAALMINEGILENPKVDIIVGLHVEEELNTGEIMIKEGSVNSASNPFTIKIMGRGGHGAYPHKTIDPIVISSQIILGFQSIISRRINIVNPAIITVGSIHGGKAPNVIPDEVVLKGIIRTTEVEQRRFIKKKLFDTVDAICSCNDANYSIDIEEGYPILNNDSQVTNLVIKSARNILGNENVKNQKFTKLGVESFAYFSNEIPAAFYFLGVRNEKKHIIEPAHSPNFNLDEEALEIGVMLQCKIALDYLNN